MVVRMAYRSGVWQLLDKNIQRTFVLLNSRLESNDDEEEGLIHSWGIRGIAL